MSLNGVAGCLPVITSPLLATASKRSPVTSSACTPPIRRRCTCRCSNASPTSRSATSTRRSTNAGRSCVCWACGARCSSSPSISPPRSTRRARRHSSRRSAAAPCNSSRRKASTVAMALVEAACAATMTALRAGEPLPGRALTPIVAELQQQVLLAEGKRYESRVSITNRILLQLSIEGRIVRTRPLGTWLSSQYRWTTTEHWFTERWPQLSAAEARTELVRRWLRTYGPGTTNDIAWWTKWTKRQVVSALGELARRRGHRRAGVRRSTCTGVGPARRPRR